MKNDDRREAARKVARAFELLPPDRKLYFTGWAEGVIDASTRRKNRKEDDACKP